MLGTQVSDNLLRMFKTFPMSLGKIATLMKTFVILILFLLLGTAHAQNTTGEFNRVVADLCDKKVVLLGEDLHHGSGETLKVKTELVQTLVNRCGFTEIFFESQLYDFVDVKRKIGNRTLTREDVANAIGGLWSTTVESQPLISFLFEKAVAGRVRLYGLDPQTGGATQLYSQRFLARDLSRYLRGARATECESELQRLFNYAFDEAHPYDESTKKRIKRCAIEIQEATESAGFGSTDDGLMARNLRAHTELDYGNTPVMSDSFFNSRDKAMFENFAWYVSRFERPGKSIIWCATVHAAKELKQIYANRHSLGDYIRRSYGEKSAVIAFSAIRGGYGRRSQPAVTLAAATVGSLEASALSSIGDNELRFLSHANLARAGVAKARAINYDSYFEANWSRIIDGLIILREERPPLYTATKGKQP